MVVQHNLTAMNANRYFGINNSKLSKSLEKLSSGYAINRAGDNAAGLAVSEKMRSQIGGLNQAVKNAQDGISMVQTFEGALTETDSILQRMKVLATQSANGSYDDPVDRNAIEQEFLQLNDELDQIADTDFNGVVVLNGGVMADGTKADPETGLINYAIAADGADEKVQITDADVAAYDGENDTVTTAKIAQAQVGDVNTFNKGAYKTAVSALKEETDVTYAYAGDGKWINNYDKSVISAKETGGFVGLFGETITLDDTALEVGDTVTVTVTPGVEAESQEVKNWDAVAAVTDGTGDTDSLTVTGDAKFEITYTGADEKALKAIADLNGGTISLANKADSSMTTFAVTGGGLSAETDATNTANALASGKVAAVYNAATNTVDFYVNKGTTQIAAGQDLTTNANAEKIGTFTLPTMTSTSTTANDDKVVYTLQTAMKSAVTGEPATVELAAVQTVSAEDKADFVERINAGVDGGTVEVSKSNAFSKSEAQMTYKKSITLQVGSRTKDAVDFTFQYNSTAMGKLAPDLNCTAYGLGTDALTLSTQEDANYAIDKIDQAINKVSMVRGTFGAIQNRLEHKIDNLNVTTENLTSAESRIRDTNMAEEMMNFTKQQILSQASQSMLAQANQLPQGVLSLLQ